MVPVRGEKMFKPRQQNRIIVPRRGSFQNVPRPTLLFLYGSFQPPREIQKRPHPVKHCRIEEMLKGKRVYPPYWSYSQGNPSHVIEICPNLQVVHE